MLETGIWAVFLIGFLGGGHCVGMCGGLSTALSLQLPKHRPVWEYLLLANLGRIASYCVAGALVGGLAQLSVLNSTSIDIKLILFVFANILIFAMGLYLANVAHWIVHIERLGQPIWRRIQPIFQRVLPIRSHVGAFCAGALWGWLPCGLVYTALLSALSSGDAYTGAWMMLAFGLGTLPNVFLLGIFALPLRTQLQKLWVRRVAGLSLCAFALYSLLQATYFV